MVNHVIDRRYSHTQRAPLHWILWALVALLLCLMPLVEDSLIVLGILACTCLLCAVLALSFRTLSVTDEGDHLEICFGPFPLFRKTVPYDTIDGAEIGRSSFLDGWGVHYLPGRGWIYNLWGFDCVCLQLGTQRLRVGTDDPDGLVAFIRSAVLESR